ncbi:MAG TPA: hypothetical protein PL131_03050 [Methylotenera sp.]|nr:hypothetical protein [Methylotenera sp.]HPH04826.1 hypothetical protein [Methylotenera sp.]HPN01724.1 hypothetical protein [Methylotenera sp.]
MKFFITSDANWESKVNVTLHALSDFGYKDFFAGKDYGEGLAEIAVFYMCRDPALNFKRRVRLSKKDKVLYMDIMLDLPTMVEADFKLRKRIVAEKLLAEVAEVLSKYKVTDFNKAQFLNDLVSFISKTGWI